MSTNGTGPRDACYRTVIVDDVEGLRRLVEISLSLDPCFEVVGQAGSGEQALAVVKDLQPDLVLLDLSMPGLDGMEVLPELLALAPGASIVVLSGFDQSALAPAAVDRGAVGYIEKGLDPDELGPRLRGLLQDAGRAPGDMQANDSPSGPASTGATA